MTFKKIFVSLTIILLFHSELFAKSKSEELINQAQKDLPKQCIFFFKMYLNAKSPKAFAYAVDSNYKYTCRFSSGSENIAKAKEIAINSCNKSREKRGIKSECKLYDIDLKGFISKRNIEFRKKYQISLQKIKQEIHKKDTKQIKSTHKKTKPTSNDTLKQNISKLPKPCHMFYKLYLDSPLNKAFAVAIDSKKRYTCKFSSKSKSLQRAKEVALNSCKKSKKSRNIKDECHIFAYQGDYIATKSKKLTKKTEKPTIKTAKTKVAHKTYHKKTKRIRNAKLEKAILDANLKEIKALIKNGYDINTEADDHSRALFVATAKGDVKFVKELLDKGAYPFFTKADGNNLLVASIMSGKIELLKLFLELGVDPNQRCSEGNTPLHFAFMMFYDDMMRELYRFGADDEIKNDKGESVKDMAKSYHFNLKKIKQSHGLK
ncbi:MAG: hypothetical protein DSZ06_02400 [Sulfurospirillum sp.]|nr:MAG: hypothetical protein DSZ06_02400 [Sulfurospirillum sp.]